MKKSNNRAGRAPGPRQLRVGEEIRHVLSNAFMRGDFYDPDLQGLSVTVTEVRVNADLTAATAFVTPFGGGDVDEMIEKLRRATPYLRGVVARAVNLKFAPSLSFQPDMSFENAERIERLLRETHADDEARRGDEDDGDGA